MIVHYMNIIEQTILAIDHGEMRIGLAIKPAEQTMALPLAVVPAEPEYSSMATIRKIIAERKVAVVVVGLPLNENSGQSQKVKRWTRKLRKGVAGVRWRFADESLTSQSADDQQRQLGLDPSTRKMDDRAAALILESFLQSQ